MSLSCRGDVRAVVGVGVDLPVPDLEFVGVGRCACRTPALDPIALDAHEAECHCVYGSQVEAPDWARDLLGWKSSTAKSRQTCLDLFGREVAPNIADVGNVGSLRFAGHMFQALEIPYDQRRDSAIDSGSVHEEEKKGSSGAALEQAIEKDVGASLLAGDPDRGWHVSRVGHVSQFAQFEHLDSLQQILVTEPTLRASLAKDYQVKTDVYVGVASGRSRLPFLHAAISSKWTIRSDRVQNVRHEFNTLVRNRRGRTPHLVLVTAEPQPSRLLSITRGTGEVDAVYHLLFDELDVAVRDVCASNRRLAQQQEHWEEMTTQNRLRPYSALVEDLLAT